MPDDDGRASTRALGEEGGAKSSPLERLSPGEAVARLADEIRAGRLDATLLLDVLLVSDDQELYLQLTSLAGQLGHSWEITG